MRSRASSIVIRINSLEQMECRANNAEKEAELLKEQLDHLKDQFNECLHQKTEVEKKLATFSSQEVSSTGSNVLVKQLQQELQHYILHQNSSSFRYKGLLLSGKIWSILQQSYGFIHLIKRIIDFGFVRYLQYEYCGSYRFRYMHAYMVLKKVLRVVISTSVVGHKQINGGS
ncbi:hypothetical protein P8452_16515 [Trifolium repens]|nr:hypothetical protein P8452_16515 [Trifolium repens]